LTFRRLPQIHGAARDALRYARTIVETELNAFQGNPAVVLEERAVISVGNTHPVAMAAALDLARIALAARVISIELAVAAQAADLRHRGPLGRAPLRLTHSSGPTSPSPGMACHRHQTSSHSPRRYSAANWQVWGPARAGVKVLIL
jgi:histidine ammonia-lyase